MKRRTPSSILTLAATAGPRSCLSQPPDRKGRWILNKRQPWWLVGRSSRPEKCPLSGSPPRGSDDRDERVADRLVFGKDWAASGRAALACPARMSGHSYGTTRRNCHNKVSLCRRQTVPKEPARLCCDNLNILIAPNAEPDTEKNVHSHNCPSRNFPAKLATLAELSTLGS